LCWPGWAPAGYNRRRQGSLNPASRGRVRGPRTPFDPKARSLRKAWRSLGSPTPDTAVWGHSPDVPVWRGGDRNRGRGRPLDPITTSLDSLKSRAPHGPYRLRLYRPPDSYMAVFSPSGYPPRRERMTLDLCTDIHFKWRRVR
jgi:hypothetical protein